MHPKKKCLPPSNLIKVTEEAQKRSRRRLLGSVALLGLALVLLLKVTAHVKPVLISPKHIEIKNTVTGTQATYTIKPVTNGQILIEPQKATSATVTSPSQTLQKTQLSALEPAKTSIVLEPINTTSESSSTPNASPHAQNATTGAKKNHNSNSSYFYSPHSLGKNRVVVLKDAPQSSNKVKKTAYSNNNNMQILSQDSPVGKDPAAMPKTLKEGEKTVDSVPSSNASSTLDSSAYKHGQLKQKKFHLANAPATSPSDILNGVNEPPNSNINFKNEKDANTPLTTKASNYIQFATLSNKVKASAMQKEIASKGLTASIQAINNAQKTLYRLRAGPFSPEEAEENRRKLAAIGFNGIITNAN